MIWRKDVYSQAPQCAQIPALRCNVTQEEGALLPSGFVGKRKYGLAETDDSLDSMFYVIVCLIGVSTVGGLEVSGKPSSLRAAGALSAKGEDE